MNKFKALYQINKDYPELCKDCIINRYTTRDLCLPIDNFCKDTDKMKRVNTNDKYPNFFQKIYTAGDKEQFYKYVPRGLTPIETKTFDYIFNILKKGVYVVILNNTLNVFLPFNNADYKNDWGHLLKFRDFNKVISIGNKLIYNKNIDKKYFREVNKNTTEWYANYNIFRNEIYSNGILKGKMDEGDKSIENFLQLLSEVCCTYKIPDMSFFMNPRDYPIIKKNGYNFEHPYDIIFKAAGKEVPSMNSYLGDGHSVVFSQSISDDYGDILIPNDDDIYRLLCPVPFNQINPGIWDKKKNAAVFRGSATGNGITEESNMRLKLLKIANEYNSKKKEDFPYMDVKITSPNTRLKLDPVSGYCDYIKKNDDFSKEHVLTPRQQSEYKYVIHVQGHVAAFRLSTELSYKSLIIRIRNPWKIWFDEYIRAFDPFVSNDYENCHIVECNIEDIETIMEWCIVNQDACRQIAENGYMFYNEYLSNKNFMIAYTANVLTKNKR